MSNKFTSGKKAIAECDRCGFRYKLKELKELVIRTKRTYTMVCPTCWEADHPQNMQGMYPVQDPQAVRNPRRDNSYYTSGLDVLGNPSDGSRVFQWGWNPVGMGNNYLNLTTNDLAAIGAVGTVGVTIT